MMQDEYGINIKKLSQLLHMPERELAGDMFFLIDEDLIYVGEKFIEDMPIHSYVIRGMALNKILLWASENNISFRTLLNTMDFSIMDA